MTVRGAAIVAATAAVLTAGAATAWPAGDRPDVSSAGPALVVDAALGRAGRDLVDPRLEASAATVRLPRTAREARTDVRYLVASGHAPVIVVGPRSNAASVPGARGANTLAGGLAAVRR